MNWESSPVTRAKSASRRAAGSSLVMSSFLLAQLLAELGALDGEVITQHEAEALTPVQGELGDQLVVGEVVFTSSVIRSCCLKRAIPPCSMALRSSDSSSMVKAAGRFPLAAMRSW